MNVMKEKMSERKKERGSKSTRQEIQEWRYTDLAGEMTFGVDGKLAGRVGDGSWTWLDLELLLLWWLISLRETCNFSSGDFIAIAGFNMVDASFEFRVTFSIGSGDSELEWDSWQEISSVSRWQGEHIFSHRPIWSILSVTVTGTVDDVWSVRIWPIDFLTGGQGSVDGTDVWSVRIWPIDFLTGGQGSVDGTGRRSVDNWLDGNRPLGFAVGDVIDDEGLSGFQRWIPMCQ